MTTITHSEIEKLSDLAQIQIDAAQVPVYMTSLTNIMNMISQLEQVDTSTVSPMAHSFEASQRLREDVVTETDQRDLFQSIAPSTAAGLYLVPKVVE